MCQAPECPLQSNLHDDDVESQSGGSLAGRAAIVALETAHGCGELKQSLLVNGGIVALQEQLCLSCTAVI